METATMEDVGDHGLYDRFELDGETFREWHSTASIECMSDGVWRSMPAPAQIVVRRRWMSEKVAGELSDGPSYRQGLQHAHGKIQARVDMMRKEYSAIPLTFVGSITRAHHEKAAAIDALVAAGTDVFDLFIKAGGSKDEVG